MENALRRNRGLLWAWTPIDFWKTLPGKWSVIVESYIVIQYHLEWHQGHPVLFALTVVNSEESKGCSWMVVLEVLRRNLTSLEKCSMEGRSEKIHGVHLRQIPRSGSLWASPGDISSVFISSGSVLFQIQFASLENGHTAVIPLPGPTWKLSEGSIHWCRNRVFLCGYKTLV